MLFRSLLGWWTAQNSTGRHLWPGNYTSKVLEGGKGEWRRGEVLAQIAATRANAGSTGNVHFTMEVFLKNRDSIATALERTAYAQPALILLDVLLPGMDGFAVLQQLRTRSTIPVLMLTGRGEAPDRIVGLELGADDYLPKTFSPRELLARLRDRKSTRLNSSH